MKAFLSILLMIVVLAPCKAQKVKPALNLVKGETYNTISAVSSSIEQTFNGSVTGYTIKSSAKTAFKVVDIKDTVYNMEVSYVSIGMDVQSPNGEINFSSDKKDAQDIPSQLLAAMVNKPFLVTLSKSGKVLSVENIGKIMTTVFNSMKLDTAQAAQLKTQFMQSFGEQAFKGTLEQELAIYPNVKVAKADKWVVNTKLLSVMEANIQTVYQLQDITDAYYLIHGDAKITTIDKDKVSRINDMPVKYNLTGTLLSDIKADKNTGWIIQAILVQDMAGELKILDNPKLPGGTTMPMKIHSQTTTTD
jgi:hypothetical protein